MTRHDDLHQVPDGLPVPVDDGACDHLRGAAMPAIELPSTAGGSVRLDQPRSEWTVVYAYPRTGLPDVDSPPGWDEIPGARGCTPQSCSFRDRHAELRALGAEVYGLSTQTTGYQREMAERLHLPFPVLSDAGLVLATALRLPTFRYGEWTLLRRFTMILREGRIEHVFYPVFPPDADAARVESWLRSRGTSDRIRRS
jgi:peroxiredoxin